MTAAPEPLSLSAFLLARLAEDEALARDVLTRGFGAEWHVVGDVWQHVGDDGGHNVLSGAESTLPHIARHDPAHVLATVAAHRRIVELHADFCETCWVHAEGVAEAADAGLPCPTLLALASIYAAHPDFRDEWRTVSPFEAAARSLASIEQPEEQR